MPGSVPTRPAIKGRLSTPDWSVIPHKGMEQPSEAELESKIDSLGKALAEARDNPRQYEAVRAEADKLMVQYVSAVSPDRKALVKDTAAFVDGASNFMRRKKSTGGPLTLFEYITKRKDAKLNPTDEGQFSVTLDSGTTITYVGSMQQPDMYEIKGKGSQQTEMSYSNGRWLYQNTPEEQVRQASFISRINQAEDHYFAELSSGTDRAGALGGKFNVTV